VGYVPTVLLNDPRIRQLVTELDQLGGAVLRRLMHTRVRANAGRAQAAVLWFVWDELTRRSPDTCKVCGRFLEGRVYLVQSEGGRTKEVCQACVSHGTWSPAWAGRVPEPRTWVTRLLARVFGARQEPKAESRYMIWQQHGTHPRAVAAVSALMRESEVPIGSVRERAVAHVKVDRRGGLFLNGQRVPVEEVERECARVGRIGGLVFYYREDPAGTAPPGVEAVIRAICEEGLPVTLAGRDYDPDLKVAEYLP
jgi:hypothetical protein